MILINNVLPVLSQQKDEKELVEFVESEMRMMMMSHLDMAEFLFDGVAEPYLKIIMGGILLNCIELPF